MSQFVKFSGRNGIYDLHQVFVFTQYRLIWGHAAGGAVGWGTALQARRSRVRFPMVSLELFIDIILPASIWLWGWLSLYQKWVPGIFPRGKGSRCVWLSILLHLCANCLEIWKPQPPGTLRACPGPSWDYLYLYLLITPTNAQHLFTKYIYSGFGWRNQRGIFITQESTELNILDRPFSTSSNNLFKGFPIDFVSLVYNSALRLS